MLLIGGLVFAEMQLGLIGGANIKVPDFKGKTMKEAQQIAEKNDLKVEAKDFETSEKYKSGEVMDQDPPAGDKVRKNTTIQLTVSKRSENGLVPKVIGMKE